MNTKYYAYLILVTFILILLPSTLCADSFKLSDPSIIESFSDLITLDNDTDYKTDYPDPDWKYVNRTNGINSFQKDITETATKAYKGVCVINSPIKTIYSVITDIRNHSKWVKFCKSSQAIGKQIPSKSTQYYQFDIPWPFSNRDMVINSIADIDWTAGRVTISCTATSTHSDIPQKEEFIRVAESNQEWKLERLTPTTTRVTFTSYTPLTLLDSTLLKKIASSTIPFSTLKNLKALSAEKYKSASRRVVVKSDADREPNAGS